MSIGVCLAVLGVGCGLACFLVGYSLRDPGRPL